MVLRRTSHAVYDTSYHLVWCPKYRKKTFELPRIRERVEQIIREINEEYGFEIEQIEVSRDHVHILLSFPPKHSIGEVVRTIKSISARELFREFAQIKRKLWSGELWEDGYFARKVGDRVTAEVIRDYIKYHRENEQGPVQLSFKLR